MALTDAQRAQLGALADQLIPAGGGMPSASEAGVAGRYLDEVLTSLPDLKAPLETALAAVDGLEPEAALAVLRDDPAAWGVLTAVVPAGYFMNPAIREAIGYPGLERRPIDATAAPDYLADGLLDSVVARGPVYRPTPTD
ncbi:hypothetical protein OJ997_09945 [Solirubrobacter phytolaccae]|uniref:Gluconate 2-dehydrogenase subunit 3 family protein n=1 Tax=Solirubrobacter phytolaccae TaxID=1404360 RepID=A0A9X3NFQ1_9ACTN|nr:hypothetical protein [Solirubrobacter phytolaccae]MDA0180612.1 hypothetical protein [Solirubrobacter phytolaccae]